MAGVDVMVDDRDARIARLEAELQRRDAELLEARAVIESRDHALAEALEQQTATAEVLRVIASSPTDLQTVLNRIAEAAATLCGAGDAVVNQVSGDFLTVPAAWGTILGLSKNPRAPLDRGLPVGRAIMDARPVRLLGEPEDIEEEFPIGAAIWRQFGVRALLCVPLVREGTPIGGISLRRYEAVPFTDEHVALLETFADQAVIAIENARLFEELERRNRRVDRGAGAADCHGGHPARHCLVTGRS